MSRPNYPHDLFPSQDPDGEFGRDEGMNGYALLASRHPDETVEKLATRATRIGMVVTGRFDIDPTEAAKAIAEELEKDLPK